MMKNFAIVVTGAVVAVGIIVTLLTPLGNTVVDQVRVWLSLDSKQETATVKGKDVALHLVEFIEHSQREDGSFVPRWRCEGETCESIPVERGIFGYAALGLLAAASSTDDASRAASDKAMARILELCESTPEVCESNFFAFSRAYQNTQEPMYLAALLKAAPSIMERARTLTIEASAASRRFTKMGRLYSLTRNDRYLSAVQTTADIAIERWPDEIRGEALYTTTSGYDVKLPMLLIASGMFVPAYRATGDERSLDETRTFFSNAEISTHLPSFGWERGMAAVVQSIEGLLALSQIEAIPSVEREIYLEEARAIMRQVVGWQYDSKEHPIFDGSNSIVTGVLVRGDYSGVNYKSTSLNGRIAVLLLNPAFAEESFVLFEGQ